MNGLEKDFQYFETLIQKVNDGNACIQSIWGLKIRIENLIKEQKNNIYLINRLNNLLKTIKNPAGEKIDKEMTNLYHELIEKYPNIETLFLNDEAEIISERINKIFKKIKMLDERIPVNQELVNKYYDTLGTFYRELYMYLIANGVVKEMENL